MLADLVRRFGAMVQVGSQQRSDANFLKGGTGWGDQRSALPLLPPRVGISTWMSFNCPIRPLRTSPGLLTLCVAGNTMAVD